MRILLTAILCCCFFGCLVCCHADERTVWKTVYVKRGFVGNYDANWAGGIDAVLRTRVQMPFAGTKVRVYVDGSYEVETKLSQLAFVRGAEMPGAVTGASYPISFAGQPMLTLPPKTKGIVSDPTDVPITPGLWYMQSQFASPKYPYAYDVDNTYSVIGAGADEKTRTIKGGRPGIVTRIDVLTTDTRSSVLCFGDSITAGYASTPDAGHRYPDYLAALINRPTLNLGVNGDLVQQNGLAALTIGRLAGVDSVIFLMGINDIIRAPQSAKEAYVKAVQQVVAGVHGQNKKIYLGTLLPAGGNKGFDNDPTKETARTEINIWIRTESKADGVIDFDAALADPQQPSHMKADCHCGDWLHPNDHGYQLMAETAAKLLQSTAQ